MEDGLIDYGHGLNSTTQCWPSDIPVVTAHQDRTPGILLSVGISLVTLSAVVLFAGAFL